MPLFEAACISASASLARPLLVCQRAGCRKSARANAPTNDRFGEIVRLVGTAVMGAEQTLGLWASTAVSHVPAVAAAAEFQKAKV